MAAMCYVIERCIAELGVVAQLYQQWVLLSKNNKQKLFVDMVVQLDHGFVGIECHGSKEHDVSTATKKKDACKAAVWQLRMGDRNPLVAVHRPQATSSSQHDGSWQQLVAETVRPALQQIM